MTLLIQVCVNNGEIDADIKTADSSNGMEYAAAIATLSGVIQKLTETLMRAEFDVELAEPANNFKPKDKK